MGKTSLVRRYVEGIFSPDYQATLGVAMHKHVDVLETDKGPLEFHQVLWDIEGGLQRASLLDSSLISWCRRRRSNLLWWQWRSSNSCFRKVLHVFRCNSTARPRGSNEFQIHTKLTSESSGRWSGGRNPSCRNRGFNGRCFRFRLNWGRSNLFSLLYRR